MAQVSKTAVSRLIASGSEASSESGSTSRDDFKKRKELEEARKLAVAPAAVDEEGKDINPHIPQYISDVPWYYDPSGPSLRHQRVQPESVKSVDSLEKWYKRGLDTKRDVTKKSNNKFKKGACSNCGATTHSQKDCLERPRMVGAKFKAVNLSADDVEQPQLSLSFDGKRDRWNGYDTREHSRVVEEYEKLEEVKRSLKKERLRNNDKDDVEDDGAASSSEDEDKYVDSMDMPGTKVDAAERYTVRNLRIREDTAKYLRNLDPNSAHYDPKTRAMRKNPYEGTAKNDDEIDYAGDNVNRVSGDTIHHARSQLFAWEAGARGLDVHALAEPTKLEALKKEYGEKKDMFKQDQKLGILEKYGGREYLDNAPPRELIFSQSEHYVEYNRQGKIVKGKDESTKVRSKYEEDVYVNNHTSVFGSFYSQGQWAYKCCHSTVKNSVCTGQAGKMAAALPLEVKESKEVAESKVTKDGVEDDEVSSSSSEGEERRRKEERRQKKRDKKRRKKKSKKTKKKKIDDISDDEDKFEKKVKAAMKKQSEKEKEAEMMLSMDERKRPYNSMAAIDDIKKVSEAEMEAYYRKRQRADDPMANFK